MTAYKKSVGATPEKKFRRVFLTDSNNAWQAILESLKSHVLDISNNEAGFIQTKWKENTAEKNFSDSFGSTQAYLKAQFRFMVTMTKGFYNGSPSVKITVQKEQLVQYDVLEGWRSIATDEIDENTLLYRIGRLIYIRLKLAAIDETRAEDAAEDFESDGGEEDDSEEDDSDGFDDNNTDSYNDGDDGYTEDVDDSGFDED